MQRPAETPGHTGSNVIEFGDTSDTLYGLNNETTEFGFTTMRVDVNGVTVTNVATDLLGGFGLDIEYAGGRIYTNVGEVIDPVAGLPVGQFPVATSPTLFVPDTDSGRTFFLVQPTAALGLSEWTLLEFDSQMQQRRATPVPGIRGNPSSLVRWGTSGLAFRTSEQQIIFIDFDAAAPIAPPVVESVQWVTAGRRIGAVAIQFDQDMDRATVEDPNNFRLFRHQRANRLLEQRTRLPITTITYDAVERTVWVLPRRSLPSGSVYSIEVGGLQPPESLTRLALDGDADGTPGGNFVVVYRRDRNPRIAASVADSSVVSASCGTSQVRPT